MFGRRKIKELYEWVDHFAAEIRVLKRKNDTLNNKVNELETKIEERETKRPQKIETQANTDNNVVMGVIYDEWFNGERKGEDK